MIHSAFSRRSFCRVALVGAALAAHQALAQSAAKSPITLADVNRMDLATFVATFGNVFEAAPWVAREAYAKKPFATVTSLHQAMFDAFRAAPQAEQLGFFRTLADVGDIQLAEADRARLAQLNKSYKDRFGYSYVISIPRSTPETVLTQLERRLRNDPAAELAVAIQQEFLITRLRLAALVTGDGMPGVNGDVGTHVANAVIGRSAVGMSVELFEMFGERSRKISQSTTNASGIATLIEGRPVPIGRYELRFAVADYFRTQNVAVGDPPYIDYVPVRFSVDNAEGHYHIPLVCTPWTYSTYRGS